MLYVKSGSTYVEMVEIKDTPDTGSDPEQIEVTTLKRTRKCYVAGRQDSPSQSFTYNYTETNYFTNVLPFCDNNPHDFLIVYPDGTGTAIRGIAVTRKNAISLNSAIEATLVITPEDIQDKTSAEVSALLVVLGTLSVISAAGTTTGKTAITVSPAKAEGNSYKYKTAASVTLPDYGATATGYTDWNGTDEITATTGNEIGIVEVDSNSKAVKGGKATVTSAS